MLTTRQLRSLSLALLVCGSGLRAGLGEPASRQLVLQAPPATSVHSVAVSPDGSLVVTAAGEGGLRLYDAATGRLLRVIGALGDRCAIFSPDGRTLAAAGFHMDKLVKTVEVATGKIVRSFAGHSQIETNAVAFSPDGKLLASACRDNEILVWDVATGALRHRLEGAPAVALAFSPDSGTLATGGADKTVRDVFEDTVAVMAADNPALQDSPALAQLL